MLKNMERSTRQRQAIRQVMQELNRPLSPSEVLGRPGTKYPAWALRPSIAP